MERRRQIGTLFEDAIRAIEALVMENQGRDFWGTQTF